MYGFARDLYPICRSITGEGVRQTLQLIQRRLPGLVMTEIPSGSQCFDWEIPPEWNVRDAYVTDESGRRIIDFREHNLHLVSYSEPVDTEISLEDLQAHLFSLPEQPDAIPYVTSYYKRFWGFCLRHRDRLALKSGRYRIKIDSDLKPGSLTFGELVIPGKVEDEILISTYVCHPSMGNNEVSGPVVTTFLAEWLVSEPRHFTYRIVYVPETVGAIAYLSRRLEVLKARVKAGFQVTCVGDNRAVSFLPSRKGDTLADRVALHVLRSFAPDFKAYTFHNDRGSDERQYCAPGVDLPMVSIMRTKYGAYPEYHTSLDDLSLISSAGLGGALALHKKAIHYLERNRRYRTTVLGEPQLGKRGLRPQIGLKNAADVVRNMSNLIAYADGDNDLLAIAERVGVPCEAFFEHAESLLKCGLFVEVDR